MNSLWQDVRYAVRTLLRAPAFTIAAVLSLALGVGANTTIFTLVNALFLNPLPVDQPSRLVAVNTIDTKNTTQFGNILPMSYPNLIDVRAASPAFSNLAGYSTLIGLAMSSGGDPEPVFGQLVTANYFEVLGVRPALGRFFEPAEDQSPGTHPVVVLSHRFWQRRFGGEGNLIGRTIRLNTIQFTVLGIAADGFMGVTSLVGPDVWLPSMMAPSVLPRESANWLDDRSAMAFTGAARLRPGLTLAQAQMQVAALARVLEQSHPVENTGRGVSLMPLIEATIFPGMRQPLMLGGIVLMVVVGLVLLIACSNVASLLMTRAESRRAEMAVRLAIGAGRGRIVQQLLTESVLLAIAAGSVGLLLGRWGRDVLWSFRPVENNFVALTMDGRVLAFAIGLSLVTALIFGLVPAWRASRSSITSVLGDARAAGSAARRSAWRRTLVAGQMALSLVALVAAALLLRSIERAYSIDPGFDASRLAVFSVNPQQARYDQTTTERFYREVRERLAVMSGVESVSWATNQPLWAKLYRRVSLEGRVQPDGTTGVLTLTNTVDVSYFGTLGVAVRRGRDFAVGDRAGAQPVAIVNDAMAAKYWPAQDVIGRRIQLEGEPTAREIVGVVATTKYQTLGEAPQPCIFVPLAQNYTDAMVLYVRTIGPPSAMLETIRRELRSLGPDVPVPFSRDVPSLLNGSLWMIKFAVGLLTVFGALALGLASVGIYGMMAFTVAQRRREMGLRIALGAAPSAVRRLVFVQAMKMVGVGLALGVVGSVVLGRAMVSILYGLSGTDPLSILAASLTLVIVAAIATYLPARRASRVDPAVALREA